MATHKSDLELQFDSITPDNLQSNETISKLLELYTSQFAGQEALKLVADRQALIRWGKDLIECDAIEPRWENSIEWIEMPEHLRNELEGN